MSDTCQQAEIYICKKHSNPNVVMVHDDVHPDAAIRGISDNVKEIITDRTA